MPAERVHRCPDRLAAKLRANFRADALDAANREIAEIESAAQRVHHGGRDATGRPQLVETRDDAELVARIRNLLRKLVVSIRRRRRPDSADPSELDTLQSSSGVAELKSGLPDCAAKSLVKRVENSLAICVEGLVALARSARG